MVTPERAIRHDKLGQQAVEVVLADEEPLQICINGRPFSITMRTPGHDVELVKGLLFGEGVVDPAGLEAEIRLEQLDGYTQAEIEIPEIYLCRDLLERRSLIANTSCGFCGKREMRDIRWTNQELEPRGPVDASLIPKLGEILQSDQTVFAQTGGSHAAAAFTRGGELLAQFEDVGRHNAVDKVVGRLIARDQLAEADILYVSGRISFEIVSKAAAAGIPVLCAVSAPSSLAVRMAREAGMTLIAFCRGDRFTVYTHPQNLARKEHAHA